MLPYEAIHVGRSPAGRLSSPISYAGDAYHLPMVVWKQFTLVSVTFPKRCRIDAAETRH